MRMGARCSTGRMRRCTGPRRTGEIGEEYAVGGDLSDIVRASGAIKPSAHATAKCRQARQTAGDSSLLNAKPRLCDMSAHPLQGARIQGQHIHNLRERRCGIARRVDTQDKSLHRGTFVPDQLDRRA